MFTNGVVPTSPTAPTNAPTTWNLTIPENYIDMLKRQAQISGTAPTNGTNIRVTLTGIPSGVTLAGSPAGAPCTVTGTSGAAALSAPGTFSSATTTSNQQTISFTAD